MKVELTIGGQPLGGDGGRWLALEANEPLSVEYVVGHENVADDRFKTVVVTLLVDGAAKPEVSSVKAPTQPGEEVRGRPLTTLPFTTSGWRAARVRVSVKAIPHDGDGDGAGAGAPLKTVELVVHRRRVVRLSAGVALVALAYASARLAWLFMNPAGTFASKCITFAMGAVPGAVLGLPIGAALVRAITEGLVKKKREWAVWFTRPAWLLAAAALLAAAGAAVPRWSTIIQNDSPATLQFTNGGTLGKASAASVLTWRTVGPAFVAQQLDDPRNELCASSFVPASATQKLAPFDCVPRLDRAKRVDWPLLLYTASPKGVSVTCREARWKIGTVLARPPELVAAERGADGDPWVQRTFKSDGCEVVTPTKASVDLGKALELHLPDDEAIARLVASDPKVRDEEPSFARLFPSRLTFHHFGDSKPATADLVFQTARLPEVESLRISPRSPGPYPAPPGTIVFAVSLASKRVGTLTCEGFEEPHVHVYWGQSAKRLHLSTKRGAVVEKASSWSQEDGSEENVIALCTDAGNARFTEGIVRLKKEGVELHAGDAPLVLRGEETTVKPATCPALAGAGTLVLTVDGEKRVATCGPRASTPGDAGLLRKALEQGCCLKHGVSKAVRCTPQARALAPSVPDDNDRENARAAGCDAKTAEFRNF